MTAAEYTEFRASLIRSYAADKTASGEWFEDQAVELATRDTDRLLPDGQETADTLLLIGETADGTTVGHLWIALKSPNVAGGAWIFDIEVLPEQRGKGYGRALLAAAERETRRHGVTALGLNVFGPNTVARRLYESAGYETTTLQMRKDLRG